MCETQHYYKAKVVRDPKVPSNYYNAIFKPQWSEAISKELDKFAKDVCLQLVPYNNQHLVPMMWTFVIKTDGTKKARLVGRAEEHRCIYLSAWGARLWQVIKYGMNCLLCSLTILL